MLHWSLCCFLCFKLTFKLLKLFELLIWYFVGPITIAFEIACIAAFAFAVIATSEPFVASAIVATAERTALAFDCTLSCFTSEPIRFKPSLLVVYSVETSVRNSTCRAAASSLAIVAFELYLEVSEGTASAITVVIVKASKLPSMASMLITGWILGTISYLSSGGSWHPSSACVYARVFISGWIYFSAPEEELLLEFKG